MYHYKETRRQRERDRQRDKTKDRHRGRKARGDRERERWIKRKVAKRQTEVSKDGKTERQTVLETETKRER